MRTSIARVTAAATAVVLATALVASPAAAAAPPRSDLQRAAEEFTALGITGVQAIVRDGRRVTEARAGVADITTSAPVPANGWFRMGSNTKTFVSVLLLQLVGERRLSLEDPVERWLPGLLARNGNDGSRITVRQLLQHTSGLPNYTDYLPAFQSPEAFEEKRYEHWDQEQLVALALEHPSLFAPGTDWSYSNTNYIVAGMLIERITHRPWDAGLQRRILEPAGMTQTFYPGDRLGLPGPHAKAYLQFVPDGPWIDATRWNTTMADAAGGMVTTPRDLVRFWQALQQGKLLRPAQLAEMHRTVTVEGRPGGYGLGIYFTPTDCGGYWGHGGDVPGYTTLDGVTADGRRAVVVSLSAGLGDQQKMSAVYARGDALLADALC